MAGGPNNPLGARDVSRRNADVIDLYERVKVGTKVVVL